MKSRNAYIDNARALGILLVVLGHVWSAPPLLLKWIYSFHIPALFVLSGYTFEGSRASSSFRSCLESRTQRLMIPYLFWGGLFIVPSVLTGQTTSLWNLGKRIAGTLYCAGSTDLTFNCSPIWFLSCLWCVSLLGVCLTRTPARMRLLLSLLSLFFGFVIARQGNFRWPWNLDVAFIGLFFFQCGALLSHFSYFDKSHRFSAYTILAASILTVSLSIINPVSIFVGALQLGQTWLFLASSLCGTLLLFEVAKLLPSNRWLTLIGCSTIPILALNYWAHDFVHRFLRIVGLPHWWLNFLVQCLLFTFLAVLLNSDHWIGYLANGVKPSSVDRPHAKG
ncbi:MAG: acyltransferase family protein [Verrucomicrobia bacterium]|jgi:acyltransferase|nr:acyltransferase family protein [Verrucomicrobiota bacterium]MBT7065310.1 acyltransferase family protein [Verrucomicrobiota bacterium]